VQVVFRDPSSSAGDVDDMVSRIVDIYDRLGVPLDDGEKSEIRGELTRKG
jgi:hypothetical protein